MVEEASRTSVFDRAGRVTGLTLLVAGGEKVSVSFEYGEQGRVRQISFDDSVQLRLDYDAAGQWAGLTFPDGGRARLVRDKDGNITGFQPLPKAGARAGRRAAAPPHQAALVKASVMFFDCKTATERARTPSSRRASSAPRPAPPAPRASRRSPTRAT